MNEEMVTGNSACDGITLTSEISSICGAVKICLGLGQVELAWELIIELIFYDSNSRKDAIQYFD